MVVDLMSLGLFLGAVCCVMSCRWNFKQSVQIKELEERVTKTEDKVIEMDLKIGDFSCWN